jgi:hypothetical protein
MTMRDRYAKNFAEALDFMQRRVRLTTRPPRGLVPPAADGWSYRSRGGMGKGHLRRSDKRRV